MTRSGHEAGQAVELNCGFIAGCDGSHGVCRPGIPEGALRRLRARIPVRPARDRTATYRHGSRRAGQVGASIIVLPLRFALTQGLTSWFDSVIKNSPQTCPWNGRNR